MKLKDIQIEDEQHANNREWKEKNQEYIMELIKRDMKGE